MSTQTETFVPDGNGGMPTGLPALTPGWAQELALVFRALADPTRVQMVSLLLGAGTSGLCVCDIVANFPLGQPTISHHLKVLKKAELVTSWKRGLWVHYAINSERLAGLGIGLPALAQPVRPSASCDTTGAYDGHGGREEVRTGGPDV